MGWESRYNLRLVAPASSESNKVPQKPAHLWHEVGGVLEYMLVVHVAWLLIMLKIPQYDNQAEKSTILVKLLVKNVCLVLQALSLIT